MFYVPLVIGCANSSILADALAFLAAMLTLNASGLNCTWSIVSRIIGLANSSILYHKKIPTAITIIVDKQSTVTLVDMRIEH